MRLLLILNIKILILILKNNQGRMEGAEKKKSQKMRKQHHKNLGILSSQIKDWKILSVQEEKKHPNNSREKKKV